MTSESAKNTNPHFIENRKNARLDIHIPASIELPDGRQVYGETVNISFGGTFLKVSDNSGLQTGMKGLFSLILQEEPVLQVISFKSKIVHVDKDGIGIKFQAVFAEHYNDFVFLMVNNSTEPNELLDELNESPGIKLHNSET